MFGRRNLTGVLLMVAVVFVVSICAPFISRAYSSEDPPPVGSILFFIRDSETTYGIGGATIEAYADSKLITTLTADDSGHVRFDAPKKGSYDFKTKADGYQGAFDRKFALEPTGKEFEVQVMLTPLVPPKEIEDGAIDALGKGARKNNEAIFMGYVVDGESGKPIEGVRVQVLNAKAQGITDERGFFSIRVAASPQPSDMEVIPPLETLLLEKSGYVSYEYQNLPTHSGVGIYTITLEHGTGKKIHKRHIRQLRGSDAQQNGQQQTQQSGVAAAEADATLYRTAATLGQVSSPVDPPDRIRVGLNCAGNASSCTSAQTFTLEQYVQLGLDNECPQNWNIQSLRACAVAYRGYGAYFVNHPVTSIYDICSNTYCQKWVEADVYDSTRAAAKYTSGIVIESGGAIQAALYSAENNNAPCTGGNCSGGGYTWASCGDGYVGRPPTWSCLNDRNSGFLSNTYTLNGHGGGLSQNGAQRWASKDGKTWKWILNHYYYRDGGAPQWSISSPLQINTISPV
ncbi:MAG: hypothetical protein HZB33_14645, partial [Nitrospirae bacterium]|nr:hypothetical protein [Nitrospirota bacterium]